MSKQLSLPTPKKGKAVVVCLLVIGLYLVISDPSGSAESVNHVVTSVQTFSATVSGGGQS